MNRFYTFLLTIFFSYTMFAQYAGEWITYYSYSNVENLSQSSNKIYAVASGNLFSVEKTSSSLDLYSRVNGLSDNNVRFVEYDVDTDQLLVVYQNSNIDIISSRGVINISDIKTKNIIGGKSINKVFFKNKKAYLACDFGIVMLDMKRREIKDTYFVGDNASQLAVKSVYVDGENAYFVSNSRLAKASLNDNLLDYSNWQTLVSENEDVSGFSKNKTMLEYGGKLLVLKENGDIYYWDEDKLLPIISSNIKGMKLSNNQLLAYSDKKLFKFNLKLECDSSFTFSEDINEVIVDASDNAYWIGTMYSGLKKYDPKSKSYETYLPNGPVNSSPAVLQIANGYLYVMQGGIPFINNNYVPSTFTYCDLSTKRWDAVHNYDIMRYNYQRQLINANSVAYSKPLDRVFVSSYQFGVFVFKDNKFEKSYNCANSPLEPHYLITDPSQYLDNVRVDGLQVDAQGNLWVFNVATNNPIKILRSNGTWTTRAYPTLSNATYLSRPCFTKSNLKMLILNQKNLFVFDDKNTESVGDDESRSFSDFRDQDAKKIGISEFHCMVEDTEGNVWVGTNKGPIVLSNTSNIFKSTYACSRIKIVREDAEPNEDGSMPADVLLGNETITAIAVDGANRKWLGTSSSGVYLVSPNGQETIAHFNTENSPMPSNQILSLAINNGDVYIGTSNGLLMYKSDAIEGSSSYSELHSFPSPVRPDDAQVTITGLMESSLVQISDVSGNMVYEATSNGGMLIWNLKNTLGKRVASGVYLVFAISKDGTKKAHARILVI